MKKMNRILFGLVALLATQPAMASLTTAAQRLYGTLPSFGAAKRVSPAFYPKPTGIGQGIFSKPMGTTFGQGTQTPSRSFFNGSKPLMPDFNSNKPSLMQPDLLRPQNLFEGQRRQYSQNEKYQKTLTCLASIVGSPSVGGPLFRLTGLMIRALPLLIVVQSYDHFTEGIANLLLDNINREIEAILLGTPDEQEEARKIARAMLDERFEGKESDLTRNEVRKLLKTVAWNSKNYEAFEQWAYTQVLEKTEPKYKPLPKTPVYEWFTRK